MIGIFDNIRAPSYPIDHPPFFICAEFEFNPNEMDREVCFTFLIIDEDGRDVLRVQPPPHRLPNEAGPGTVRLHLTVGVGGLRLERPGQYRMDVLFDGRKVAEEGLPVLQVS
jgi:hypothetical protein